MSRAASIIGVVAGCLSALCLTPSRAEACGGFFCGGTPIDQTGEKIAFAVKNGHVTATIQITFAGNAKDFAWIVPVASKPTLSVGSNALFQYLDNTTRPYFYPEWQYSSQCGGYAYPALAEDASAGGPPNQSPGVTVVSTEEVGPYDAAILQATDAASLLTWLHDNKFDVPDAAKDPINGYIGKDAYFVALKLQQDKGTGDLQPITLDFTESRPCVPIRLTRIAAQPDMGITAWVFADVRGIPDNYKHVVVNETRIDWINYGANYRKVIGEAIDEGGGLAFTTEFAGKASTLNLKGMLYGDGRYHLDVLRTKTQPWDYVNELLAEGFPRDAQMQNLLRKFIPMPASVKARGVTEQQFYNNLSAYQSDLASQVFKPGDFTDELDRVVVQPLKAAQAMVDGSPYVTRLFTTMDPNEMQVDPTFDFNPDLPDVSNRHTAKAEFVCSAVSTGYDPHQLVRITLQDGRVLYTHLDDPAPETGPFAERVEQLTTSGAPLVVVDNSKPIDTAVKERNDKVGVPQGEPTKASGCSTAAGAALWPAALAALGLAFRRRRA